MLAERVAQMFDELRDQVVSMVREHEHQGDQVTELQQQLTIHSNRVEALEAELHELRQLLHVETNSPETPETCTPPSPMEHMELVEWKEASESEGTSSPRDEEDASAIASALLRQIYAVVDKAKVKPDAPQVQEIPASRDVQLTSWKCIFRHGMDVRSWPQVQRTGIVGFLNCGQEFQVCEERPGRDGTVFLKLSDGLGWVFTKSRSGRFCVRVEKESAAENAWRDYKGPDHTSRHYDTSRDYDSHHTWSTSSTWRDREDNNNPRAHQENWAWNDTSSWWEKTNAHKDWPSW